MTERVKSLLERTFDKEQRKFRRDVDWAPLLARFVDEGVGDEARARIGLEEMLRAETPAFMDGDIQECIDQLTRAENAERMKEAEM